MARLEQLEFDIGIMGAGLVGLVAAKLCCDLGFKVAIFDKNSSISLQDSRTLALNAQAKELLLTLNLWHELEYQVISNMYLAHENGYNNIEINHQQAKLPALAYHIENINLLKLLTKKLSQQHNLTWFWQTNVTCFLENILYTQHQQIKAKLWLAADGSKSWLRKQAGIYTTDYDYQQTALSAKVTCTDNHQNTAYQKFLNKHSAVLGCLPCKNPHELAIIFSGINDYNYDHLTQQQLLGLLTSVTNSFFGNIISINNIQIFNLSNTIAHTIVKLPVILIGDSAHQLHPMAGQGFNLALTNLYFFYQQLKFILRRNYNINNPNLWSAYNTQCLYRTKIWNFAINSVYKANNSPYLGGLVHSAFNTISNSNLCKTWMINYANHLPC